MALITYLSTIRFGSGELAGLKDDLNQLGVRRPLIVADEGIVQAGLVERVVQSAPGRRNAPVFKDTPTNPTERPAPGSFGRAKPETSTMLGTTRLVAAGTP